MSNDGFARFITGLLTFIFAVSCLLLICINTHADLGGEASSPSETQASLHAKHLSSVSRTHYSVEESIYAGTKVREFIANGRVFAVAWNGLSHPDPTTILGSYYSAYKVASQIHPETSRARGSRNYAVTSGSFVLEKQGHMRNVSGRAYDTNLFPLEFTLEDIK